jgi:hypothetical protein
LPPLEGPFIVTLTGLSRRREVRTRYRILSRRDSPATPERFNASANTAVRFSCCASSPHTAHASSSRLGGCLHAAASNSWRFSSASPSGSSATIAGWSAASPFSGAPSHSNQSTSAATPCRASPMRCMCSRPAGSLSDQRTTVRSRTTSNASGPGVEDAPVTVPRALSPALWAASLAGSPSTRIAACSGGHESTNSDP